MIFVISIHHPTTYLYTKTFVNPPFPWNTRQRYRIGNTFSAVASGENLMNDPPFPAFSKTPWNTILRSKMNSFRVCMQAFRLTVILRLFLRHLKVIIWEQISNAGSAIKSILQDITLLLYPAQPGMKTSIFALFFAFSWMHSAAYLKTLRSIFLFEIIPLFSRYFLTHSPGAAPR